jgi:hypothetical protein
MNFRLVDYLVLMTETFAESLFLLAGLLGEERALRVIEAGVEREKIIPLDQKILEGFRNHEPHLEEVSGDPYQELQMKIDRLRHHPQMEFYVWSYSGYRVWAEEDILLDAVWLPTDRADIEKLEKDATDRFLQWYKNLQIPEVLEQKCLEVLGKPWKRFQHELYKTAGHTPFRVIDSRSES